MIIKVNPECGLFNCDKRRGSYCCYYCDKDCDNRCINDPSACGNYLRHKNFCSWLTKVMPKGEIKIKGTQKECLRKLSEYEATKLQPQDVEQLAKRCRQLEEENKRLKEKRCC